MPPKVCFISPEYWPLTGGTGSYVYYLSNQLLKNGYKIYVVTGANQAQDVHVNPQLDVSFLKIPKMPNSEIVYACSRQQPKTPKRQRHRRHRHHPSPTASDT